MPPGFVLSGGRVVVGLLLAWLLLASYCSPVLLAVRAGLVDGKQRLRNVRKLLYCGKLSGAARRKERIRLRYLSDGHVFVDGRRAFMRAVSRWLVLERDWRVYRGSVRPLSRGLRERRCGQQRVRLVRAGHLFVYRRLARMHGRPARLLRLGFGRDVRDALPERIL